MGAIAPGFFKEMFDVFFFGGVCKNKEKFFESPGSIILCN